MGIRERSCGGASVRPPMSIVLALPCTSLDGVGSDLQRGAEQPPTNAENPVAIGRDGTRYIIERFHSHYTFVVGCNLKSNCLVGGQRHAKVLLADHSRSNAYDQLLTYDNQCRRIRK